MFPKNDLSGDTIVIYPWREGKPLEIEWAEHEGWDDICTKLSVCLYERYGDFYDEECEEKFEFPYSVYVYELREHYLISKSSIEEFEDMEHTCVVDKNYFNIVLFYKEMCEPFTNKNFFNQQE